MALLDSLGKAIKSGAGSIVNAPSNNYQTGYSSAPAIKNPSAYSYGTNAAPTVVNSLTQGSKTQYPVGFNKNSVNQAPSSALGMLGAFISPTSTAIKSAGKTFLNQVNYGMNDEAAANYQNLLNDPSNAGMSAAELVQKARAPYMAANNLNANPAAQPSNMSNEIWSGLSEGQRNFFGNVATGSGGNDGSNLSYSNNGNNIMAQDNANTTGATVSGDNGQYFNGGYTGTAVEQLSQARAPRGMAIDSIYGSTRFNPLTGQMDTTTAPEYEQFQQGLLGQLQGSQEAYQSFDPQDAASEYLRGVNAIREPLRQGKEQSALSRLVQSGKLGSTAGTQALAQLASEQENQRFQEGVQATQYGADMQDRMLRNQAGMFGLTSQVANQQFLPQQQAMAAVPVMQEIYGFAQEPQFQESQAKQGIAAQRSANNTQNWWDLGTAALGTQGGQDIVAGAWDWLTS